MRFVITAGPTREYLDGVRFLSNASSGRMGFAIARAAVRAGHSVCLVSGPVALADPKGVRVTRVTTAQEMYEATARLFHRADCLIGAAAPSDFKPVKRLYGKAKKTSIHSIKLENTVDILATLGRCKRCRQVIIAFALEVQRPVANALAKLKEKNADAIVLNSPAAMSAKRSTATIFFASGNSVMLQAATKERIGRMLVMIAAELHFQQHGAEV